ncbi:MAG: hypothetical protein IIC62_03685, partial [Proteobacteria bacterium]|nr:hypothetical protein [Pseudomonadota bacterium]
MTRLKLLSVFLACLTACAAGTGERTGSTGLTFIHINDTYRIGAVESGNAGGLGRVVTIVRDQILVASVDTAPPGGVLRDADGNVATDVGYIRILQFTARTPQELLDAVDAAVEAGAVGLIIDVRSNPGGLLVETAQTADMFLDSGMIVIQVDRNGLERSIEARPGVVTDLPLVILQDEFSASGSELLAAALQENGRATVVGTRSFGKGTVNHTRELSNGGAIYVSIARW